MRDHLVRWTVGLALEHICTWTHIARLMGRDFLPVVFERNDELLRRTPIPGYTEETGKMSGIPCDSRSDDLLAGNVSMVF
ncbi:MAG TPA: hypothetical protein VKQ36_03905 [Ktedonobacterales bacterium]|nr:hypothetical protein [Ktedonobacterales bacterium]